MYTILQVVTLKEMKKPARGGRAGVLGIFLSNRGQYLQGCQMFQLFGQAQGIAQAAAKAAQAMPGHPHGITAAGGLGHGLGQVCRAGGQGRGKAKLCPPYLGFKKRQT